MHTEYELRVLDIDTEKVIKKLDFNKELNILVKEALKGLLK